MSYDEPPEPTEEEIEEAHAANRVQEKPIQILGLTTSHVDATIRGILSSHWRLEERIQKKLDEAIDEHVGKLLNERTAARIDAAIDAAIAEGFGTYDKYSGRVTGKTSIGELVHQALNEQTGDYYDRKGTRAQVAVRKAVEELFEKTLKSEVDALRADFKKQADEVFKAKLVAGMKEAIGLRS